MPAAGFRMPEIVGLLTMLELAWMMGAFPVLYPHTTMNPYTHIVCWTTKRFAESTRLGPEELG